MLGTNSSVVERGGGLGGGMQRVDIGVQAKRRGQWLLTE